MDNKKLRILLFLVGCIGTRSLLTYYAKITNDLQSLSIITFIIGFGFIYIYANDLRKTGPEVFGDVIWWNLLRPIHGSLYLLFSYLAYNQNKNAWLILLHQPNRKMRQKFFIFKVPIFAIYLYR
jgi:hypothetical protein